MNQDPEFENRTQSDPAAEAEQQTTEQPGAGEAPAVDLRIAEQSEKAAVAKLEQQYKVSRMNLLLVLAFTFINMVLALAKASFYMLFSASIPFEITVLGVLMADDFGIGFTVFMFGLSVVLLLPYLLSFIFSKKHFAWMIAALVWFSLDSILFLILVFMAGSWDISILLDFFFHAWILFYLINGVRYGYKLRQRKKNAEPEKSPDL